MASPRVQVNDSIWPSMTMRDHLTLSWSDGNGGFFVYSEASLPLPDCQPHPADSVELPRVYAAGDVSAIHGITFPQVTREHVTLAFLKGKEQLGFAIPNVLYHGEWDGRYYLILSRVPGRTVTEAWPAMNEGTQQYYVQRVAELYLRKGGSPHQGELRRNCAQMGMDVSSLVLYHCDLGPGNILVDTESRGIGIIDWEIAGNLPKEWVTTKFHLSLGMDLPNVTDEDARSDWRRFVARKLSEMGFEEAIDGWLSFETRDKSS
ncbi:hypothetical protein N657DRAFT_659238 [Parathielavia appendiculata]|uniref:Aminoglycoside phosphotransferase domain-containing protein n=1 Tax=Parathielavia appendiculata TaxID=2587402 RepID=A0AAN6TRX6_9PEZI|nr:hypothetical protein N657DRAFT_659238 [Parathielavia appendiculata]